MKRGEENCIQVIGRNTRGKGTIRKTRCRWEDTNKMDIVKIGWGGVDWISLAQDSDFRRAPVNTVLNFQVP
jgi:hypothetical protein